MGGGVASAAKQCLSRFGGIAQGDLDFCASEIDSPEQGIHGQAETRIGMIT
jgi:hypothetical protein